MVAIKLLFYLIFFCSEILGFTVWYFTCLSSTVGFLDVCLFFVATSGEEHKLWMNFLPVTLKLTDQTPLLSVQSVGNGKRLLVGAKGYGLLHSPQWLSLHAACPEARAVQQALHEVLHFGVKWLLVAGLG